jgi:Ca2+-binding EF-hand superfamily protein
MRTMTIVLAACIFSLLATAGAQQTGTPEDEKSQGIPATPHQEQAAREIPSDQFKQLDADHDGSISEHEAQADSSLSGSWSDLDQNGDGSLDMEEFSASSTETDPAAAGTTKADMPATPHQEHAVEGGLMQELDEDGNGKISQQEAEAEAQLSDNWDQLDRNGDGNLDSSELDRLDQ